MPNREVLKKGVVVSISGENTVKIKVGQRKSHPFYGKVINVTQSYIAHNPENKAKKGDEVTIKQTRPISKSKNWVVKSIDKALIN